MATTTDTTIHTTAPATLAAPEVTTRPRTRRRVGRLLLDVLGELGRQPSLLDPWMLMAPHYPSAGSRYRE